jgi:hypothetical protein
MDNDNKKKIILNEIEYWKNSKLLPEHYCDFLSTLYRGSEVSDDVVAKRKNSAFKSVILSCMVILLVCSILVFYFIDFSNQMQMYIFAFFILLAYFVGINAHRKQAPYAHILFSGGCFLILVAVTRFLQLWGIDAGLTKALLLLASCFIWFLTGAYFRIFYLQFIGLFSLIMILGWSTLPYFKSNFSWLLLESVWLTMAAIIFLFSWVTRNRNSQISLTLFFNSVILLFVPIIQAMYIPIASLDIIQLLLFVKIIALSLILFFSRDRLIDIIKMMSK